MQLMARRDRSSGTAGAPTEEFMTLPDEDITSQHCTRCENFAHARRSAAARFETPAAERMRRDNKRGGPAVARPLQNCLHYFMKFITVPT
jgi:hypothetical protein